MGIQALITCCYRAADLPPTGTRVGDADITNDLLKSVSAETQVADSQKQGLLSRRFSLGWREKTKVIFSSINLL